MLIEEFMPETEHKKVNDQVDLVVCSLPVLSIDRVPGAPALLIAAAQSAGYSAIALDLSINFFNKQCSADVAKFYKLGSIFIPNEDCCPEAQDSLSSWISDSIGLLKFYNPKFIGLSVFSFYQHRATRYLAIAIRKELPDTKIIIGGYGCNISANSLLIDGIKKTDSIQSFYRFMQSKNLTDYVVLDNALDRLIEILDDNSSKEKERSLYSINESIVTFDTPIPDYKDYNLNQYLWNNYKSLPVTGSYGCVRACTFCDVPGQFGRFKYRTGKDIANEIIFLHEKHGIKLFEFTDSLVNGSFKAFLEWLEILANYNEDKNEDEKIRWFGQYICRPQKNTPKQIYDLMRRSGVQNLSIGVESGSNEVLASMQKKMTVEDFYDELEQFAKHKIEINVLMLSSFYNETWDRFLESLKLIVYCQKYVILGVISKISVGTPLFINDKMHLGKAADELNIVLDQHNILNWKIKDDPTFDIVERSRRRLITQVLLDKLKIPLSYINIDNMYQICGNLKKIEKDLIHG